MGASPDHAAAPPHLYRPARLAAVANFVSECRYQPGRGLDLLARSQMAVLSARAAVPHERRISLLAMAMMERYPHVHKWGTAAFDGSDPALCLVYRFLVDGTPTSRMPVPHHRYGDLRTELTVMDRHGKDAHRLAVLCRMCGNDWLTALDLTAPALTVLERIDGGVALGAEFASHYVDRLRRDGRQSCVVHPDESGRDQAVATLDAVVTAVQRLLVRRPRR